MRDAFDVHTADLTSFSQFTGYPDLTKEQWTGVLRLSRQWDMPEVRRDLASFLSGCVLIKVTTWKVATLAIKKMDQLLLTPIEKVQLGKLHGVPRWLKDGYTSLIGNVGSSTLEELKSLGSETAIRILYAQNQAHATIKENTVMYCGQCISNRNGFQYVTRGQTGSYRCTNGWCNTDAMTSSHGAYTKVDFSAPKLASNSSVSEQVTELFKDEIQDAERRETLPPT